MTERQSALFDFIKTKHGDQVRKYTGEPYWNHLFEVAEAAGPYGELNYEIGLCHDVIEDTTCTLDELFDAAFLAGYMRWEAHKLCLHVDELTDKYTKEAFPKMNRAERKKAEARRLGTTSTKAQTVKYADMVNNTKSIVQYDPDFGKTYIVEKKRALDCMRLGHIDLLIQCCHTFLEAETDLRQRGY